MNYNDTEIEGAVGYRRCRQVVFDNQAGSPFRAEFFEQDVLVTPERTFRSEAGSIVDIVGMADLTTEFPLVDPVTLEPTDQKATYAQVFGLVQSAYLHLARSRDSGASV